MRCVRSRSQTSGSNGASSARASIRRACRPPGPAVAELRRGGRPAVGDLAAHLVDEGLLFAAEGTQLALAAGLLGSLPHAPAQQRLCLERQQRGLVRPELE